jgi:6-hydroxycyclohex-1-ene-1-carbonyl-CoA dehydrogenase
VTATIGEDDVAIELVAAQGSAGVGKVVEAGERAGVLLGHTVLVGPIDPCGECEICRRGGAPVCPLARRRGEDLPRRVIAAARWVVAFGDGLELPVPAAAAVAGDVAIAYTLYARTGVAAREPVVVVGASPITRFLVEILIAKGITPAVVADPALGAWVDWLLAKGVPVARTPGDEGAARSTVTAAFAAQGLGTRPWRVIVTSPEAAELGAALAGPRATLTVLAPVPALPADLMTREVTVIGVAGAHPDLVVEAAAMCVKGEIDLAGGTSATRNRELRALVEAR